MIFTPNETSLFNIAHNAFMIFSFSLLFDAINIEKNICIKIYLVKEY